MSKRNIVVYGNCQAAIVAAFLQRFPGIRNSFDVCHHFVNMLDDQRDDWQKQIDGADIVLAQDVTNWAVYPFKAEAETKRLVMFPFLRFAALWPFDATLGLPDDVAGAARSSLPHDIIFDYQDSLLVKLRTEMPDPEDRFLAYKNLSYGRTINLRRFLDAETARLRAMDEQYGAGIGEYIISNFRTERLFHTITHPTIDMLRRLAASACKSAELPHDFDLVDVGDDASSYQVPLHPRVIDQLGIEWANGDTRYNFKRRVMTFEAYYRSYIFLYG